MRRRSNTRRTREVELGESDQAENATGENENRNLDGGDESSPAKQGRLSMDDESSSLLQDANLQEAAPRLRTSRAIARPIAWVAAALSTMALIVAIVVAGVLLYRQ